MNSIAYVIKWSMPKRPETGAVRCSHITEFPVCCLRLTDGTFYPDKSTADDFLYKFQRIYEDVIEFNILKAFIDFKETQQ